VSGRIAGPLGPFTTVDYHTGGEPFRIVTSGVPPLEGRTVLERRAWAAANLEPVRHLLVDEPRGHADMYGCFVTPPDDDGADLGVVFFHNEGYSTACGHGTIALVTWAIESGRLAGPEVVVDAPSGRLRCVARRDHAGRVLNVRFDNVLGLIRATPLRSCRWRTTRDGRPAVDRSPRIGPPSAVAGGATPPSSRPVGRRRRLRGHRHGAPLERPRDARPAGAAVAGSQAAPGLVRHMEIRSGSLALALPPAGAEPGPRRRAGGTPARGRAGGRVRGSSAGVCSGRQRGPTITADAEHAGGPHRWVS